MPDGNLWSPITGAVRRGLAGVEPLFPALRSVFTGSGCRVLTIRGSLNSGVDRYSSPSTLLGSSIQCSTGRNNPRYQEGYPAGVIAPCIVSGVDVTLDSPTSAS